MNGSSIEVEFNPDRADLENLLQWTTFPTNNWSEIESCFERGCFVVALFDKKPVAFIAYKFASVCIYISIAETHSAFQNRGIGKKLINAICERYSGSDYKALFLRCSPLESQFAWEKIGFTHYPRRARENRNEVYMYLIYGDVCEVMAADEKMDDLQDVIKIYDTEFPRDDVPAKWFAKIDVVGDTGKLKKPLLFFGNEKWQISIRRNGVEKVKERYKNYDRNSTVYECFYIAELK